MQKDNTSSSQLSFILGANWRYIFIIKNTVCRIRSEHFQNSENWVLPVDQFWPIFV